MFLKIIKIAWMFPFSWVDAIRCRKLDVAIRYLHMQKWCHRILRACKVTLDVVETAPIPQDVPIFYVSNHQGTLDPLMIVAALKTPMTFVSKVENNKIPVISSWAKSIDMIYFDRDDSNSAIHMLRESARYLKRGQNILIFPEGTRSKGETMLPFKSGAIKPAYLGKAVIVPVAQVNVYDGENVVKRGGTIRIVLGTPRTFEAYKPLELEELSNQLHDEIQELVLANRVK